MRAIMTSRRGRDGFGGFAAKTLAGLLLVGILAGAGHRHEARDSEERCTLCALVHVVVTPAPTILSSAPLRPAEAVVLPASAPPSAAKSPTASSRAPPSS